MLNDTTLATFKANLRGELIQGNEPGYAEARKLYNGMINKRPWLIARCADVADVITAVQFGQDHELLTAIRGGGHNGPGLGSCDDGLALDLSSMKGIRVDPANRTVRVGPGCTQGDVDRASHDTAWNYREATWSMVIAGIDPDPTNAGALAAWARGYWEAVHPHTLGEAYLNFL